MSLGGEGGRCVRLTTLPPSCADCLEIWEPQSPGILRACNVIALPLPFIIDFHCRVCDDMAFEVKLRQWETKMFHFPHLKFLNIFYPERNQEYFQSILLLREELDERFQDSIINHHVNLTTAP
jgi:hypothetical protein